MRKRQEARFGPSQQGKGNTAAPMVATTANPGGTTGRSRYKFIQKECTELLDSIGVVTVTSLGEAEAACAALDRQGIVDGCITIDGDAFLYGAKTVYRNLSTDIHNFVCQEYSMELIESRLKLSRDKLIAMAILFGCDYLPDGVPGIKREQVLQLLSSWENGQALETLRTWLNEEVSDETIPPRPAHCSQCKHPGSLRSHTKSGCPFCNTSSNGCKNSNNPCQCEWHSNELRYEELSIRAKVYRLKDELDFEKILTEFSNEIHLKKKSGSVPPWKMPSVKTFVSIATKKLKWEPQYAAEKVLPLLSRWIIIHGKSVHQGTDLPVVPLSVLKKRVKRGCPMYEVEWKFTKEAEHFPAVFQTLEPQFLLEREFPELVPIPIPKPIKGTRKKNNPRPAKSVKKKEVDLVTMFTKIALEPKTRTVSPVPSDISLLDLTGGTDDSDLSAIVNDICSRKTKVISKKRELRLPMKSSEDEILERQVEAFSESLLDHSEQENPNRASERPLPNFSLNFSLGKFLESSVQHPFDSLRNDQVTDVCSTPIKSPQSEEQDSFSTPSPLVDRFSRCRI